MTGEGDVLLLVGIRVPSPKPIAARVACFFFMGAESSDDVVVSLDEEEDKEEDKEEEERDTMVLQYLFYSFLRSMKWKMYDSY